MIETGSRARLTSLFMDGFPTGIPLRIEPPPDLDHPERVGFSATIRAPRSFVGVQGITQTTHKANKRQIRTLPPARRSPIRARAPCFGGRLGFAACGDLMEK